MDEEVINGKFEELFNQVRALENASYRTEFRQMEERIKTLEESHILLETALKTLARYSGASVNLTIDGVLWFAE